MLQRMPFDRPQLKGVEDLESRITGMLISSDDRDVAALVGLLDDPAMLMQQASEAIRVLAEAVGQ